MVNCQVKLDYLVIWHIWIYVSLLKSNQRRRKEFGLFLCAATVVWETRHAADFMSLPWSLFTHVFCRFFLCLASANSDLTGTIPTEIGFLTSLTQLDLGTYNYETQRIKKQLLYLLVHRLRLTPQFCFLVVLVSKYIYVWLLCSVQWFHRHHPDTDWTTNFFNGIVAKC